MTIKIVSPEEAIAIKYFRNAYLATKVSFFNEIYDFCSAYDLNFDQVRGGVATDERIGHSHTFVFPDQDVRGFGGMCFPKDTTALRKMAANKNISLNILDAAVKYNNEIKNNT
jgi:UDPglucose 6-dehydrogenase